MPCSKPWTRQLEAAAVGTVFTPLSTELGALRPADRIGLSRETPKPGPGPSRSAQRLQERLPLRLATAPKKFCPELNVSAPWSN